MAVSSENYGRVCRDNQSLKLDAERYRFLRDIDNWGEDSGDTNWRALGEASGLEFDAIVDSRVELRAFVDKAASHA